MVLNINYINEEIRKDAAAFIARCEEEHKKQYEKILELINSRMPKLKIICVAGPSSSGKTTFSNILHNMLAQKGIGDAVLSLDDYFFNKVDLVPEPDGSIDFESIKCVDVKKFQQDLLNIIRGNETSVPRYNFNTGRREENYRTIALGERGLVFVEGIHALNYEALFNGADKDLIMGIYISPEDDYEVDGKILDHVQTRLLRRIVRDVYYRNSSMMNTMDMWRSVRKGEYNYIFPYKKNADITFNSSLAYEVCILKDDFFNKYNMLSEEDKEIVKSWLDVDLLLPFETLPDSMVPEGSLLNEFILK